MSRKVKTKVGFPGNIKEIEVTVEDADPDPWGAETKLAIVGTNIPRLDGPAKVTGRAKYTYDIAPKNLLYGKILRSPHGAAVIKSLDVAAAKKLPGVKAVITGDATKALKKRGEDVLFHGDEVAAVAAESEDIAEEAIRLIKVEYDDRKPVTSIEAAMKEGAPQAVPKQPNVKAGRGGGGGDPEATIAKADHKVEAVYSTEVQTHSCLETHGMVAHFDGDTLMAWVSTQAVGGCYGEVAGKAGGRQTRVIAEHVGGGFGAKFSIGPEGAIALELAKEADRPVKLMLDRKEEHLNGGNRPSSLQRYSGGVMKDGQMAGIKIESFGSGGVGNAGTAQPGFYTYGGLKKTESNVLTNAGMARAFRAPGHPQGYFGMESFLDELAAAAGIDPLDFRKKNCKSPTHLAEMDLAAEKFGWASRRKAKSGSDAGPRKKGAGMACSTWYSAGGGNWKVDILIDSKGAVEVRSGTQDIGTGTRTVLAVIVAEELGIPLSQVTCRLGDSNFPQGPGSGGSQTAPSIGPAARTAAYKAKQELLERVADSLKAKLEDLDIRDGKVTKRGQPTSTTFADLCSKIGVTPLSVSGQRQKNFAGFQGPLAGVQMAEVEVDIETGQVRVLKVCAVQDAGRVVDKLTFESQVSGGVIQGVSYALFEERRLDPHLGVMVNPDFLNYKIAGAKDCPEITAIAFDMSSGFNNVGMMGLGEPPTIPTAAAIANAVANAIGARVRSLPITPDKVLAALEGKK
jgi:xanthine dehydrogenase YagR molybdenum-binding subunit